MMGSSSTTRTLRFSSGRSTALFINRENPPLYSTHNGGFVEAMARPTNREAKQRVAFNMRLSRSEHTGGLSHLCSLPQHPTASQRGRAGEGSRNARGDKPGPRELRSLPPVRAPTKLKKDGESDDVSRSRRRGRAASWRRRMCGDRRLHPMHLQSHGARYGQSLWPVRARNGPRRNRRPPARAPSSDRNLQLLAGEERVAGTSGALLLVPPNAVHG